jgi:hypothetical protein
MNAVRLQLNFKVYRGHEQAIYIFTATSILCRTFSDTVYVEDVELQTMNVTGEEISTTITT